MKAKEFKRLGSARPSAEKFQALRQMRNLTKLKVSIFYYINIRQFSKFVG